jgi:hypothetical protein
MAVLRCLSVGDSELVYRMTLRERHAPCLLQLARGAEARRSGFPVDAAPGAIKEHISATLGVFGP